jgi:hypothetical protein
VAKFFDFFTIFSLSKIYAHKKLGNFRLYLMSTFSNLTSSEWAAWIQALGSVLAIGAAARLAIYQSREQHKSALALHNREKLDVQIDINRPISFCMAWHGMV